MGNGLVTCCQTIQGGRGGPVEPYQVDSMLVGPGFDSSRCRLLDHLSLPLFLARQTQPSAFGKSNKVCPDQLYIQEVET